MTGAEPAFWLGLRVERGTDVIPAATAVQNCQAGDLGGQIGFALVDKKLPKLGSERGKHFS